MHGATKGAACAVAAAVVALAAACGGGGGASPAGCGDKPACGALARCLEGSCVEDLAPMAVLSTPGGPRALELSEFDGSASSDPDAAVGDQVAAFRWSFTSLDGACAAPLAAGTGSTAKVRFACAGRFGVALVVADALGLESLPATGVVEVAPAPAGALVVAGPDQVAQHACGGAPLVCTAEGTPTLTAGLAPGVAPVGAVAYRWSVDAAPDPGWRVAFLPSADAQGPSVRLEVDGTGVVGDWVFRVAASDEAGPLGEAVTRVSVGNRPPVLAAGVDAVAVDHAYAGGQYTASAAASRWRDPDGDPLAAAGISGSADCTGLAVQADGTARVGCARPFNGALGLPGFAGDHVVSLRVKDPWAAAAAPALTTVTIRNRPPAAADTSATTPGKCINMVCCTQDACDGPSCFASTAAAHLDVSDPDGDPVQITWQAGGDFTSAAPVCELASCSGEGLLPAYRGCAGLSGALHGSFQVSDGLAGSALRTLTLSYVYK